MKTVLNILWPVVILIIFLLFVQLIHWRFKIYLQHKARSSGFAFARNAVLVTKTMTIQDLLDEVQEAKDFHNAGDFDDGVLDFISMDRAFNYTMRLGGFDPEIVEASSNQKKITND